MNALPTAKAQLAYTLSHIHTSGRESLTHLITALRLLDQEPLPLHALANALDHVVITNATDADRLLACLQLLDSLIAMKSEETEVPHAPDHPLGSDPQS